MARSTPARSRPKPAPAPTAPALSKEKAGESTKKQGHRDTVEAFAVAFILAFLVKGFEAEAFVIPTGSMAPTLMGRHKEVTCPECGYEYAVNASEESEGVVNGHGYERRVYSGICVNCRFQARVDQQPSFKGDRILVMKFPYEFPSLPGSSGPARWDVVVFRYPEEPETSYIKRLVGLPGETVRIWHGDVFVQPPEGGTFQLQRKPLEHQLAMQMMVYDDAHRARSLQDHPEWRRWTSASGEAWAEETLQPGTFRASSPAGEWAELRYRHLVPDPLQWRAIEENRPLPHPPRPSLITDFYSYNTGLYVDNSDLTGDVSMSQESAWRQPHWVGDLTLSCRLSAEASEGVVRLELIKGGVPSRCEIDLKSGTAYLEHGDEALSRASTRVSWNTPHDVQFANVDQRLTLWVDGRPVFGEGVVYKNRTAPPSYPLPTAEDLAPARIAVQGAKVQASELVLKRDIYYTVDPERTDYGDRWDQRIPRTPAQLAEFLANPAAVAALGPLGWQDFPITNDHYFMMGDNSPRSKDSRAWSARDRDWDPEDRRMWEVPRKLLTGKAFVIYWPHGKPFGPDWRLTQDLRLPFRPYFERMKLIH